MAPQGATIFGCASPRLGADERDFFARVNPWGFILFDRNVETPAQLSALIDDLRMSVGRNAPVLIDQEGGRVQRLWPPAWRQWPPAADQVAGLDTAAAARVMWLRGRLIADELSASGIDVNCAPLADIARPETHPFLKNRLYGDEAGRVATLARALFDGQMDGGVLGVLKHLPGHGRATTDSHLGLPRVRTGLDGLVASDFRPFARLADLPLAMTSHLVFDAIDPELPVTHSARAIDFIREVIGIRGAIMTDDIGMEALSGPVASRAADAQEAGCDLILHCNGNLAEMEAVAGALRPLGGLAAERTDRALAARQQATDVDIAALGAELDAILAGGGPDGD